MRSMRSDDAVALKKVERLLNLEHHVFADRAQHRPRVFEGDAVDRLAALQLVGLPRTGGSAPSAAPRVGVAADREVAGEDRLIALEDVDVGGARPGIEQHHDLPRLDAVVHFEGVLQREASTSTTTALRPACAITPV
jgi:hypothetical protein